MRLENKVALVTGGASGIGRATALLFAREGAKVVVSDLNATGADDTVQQIRSDGGVASTVAGDVSDSSDAKRMVEATIESYGRIDVALNSAGIISDFAVPSDATFEDRYERVIAVYDRVLEINLRGYLSHLLAGNTTDEGEWRRLDSQYLFDQRCSRSSDWTGQRVRPLCSFQGWCCPTDEESCHPVRQR